MYEIIDSPITDKCNKHKKIKIDRSVKKMKNTNWKITNILNIYITFEL